MSNQANAEAETTIRPAANWQRVRDYTDILFEKVDGMAKITINRPEVRNAFRPQTGEGFVLSGVCMKSLFIISLLLVLSCKEEVDMPVVPQSNNSHQWVKPDTTEDAFVLGN